MLYQIFEMNRMALGPARAMMDASRLWLRNPLNPLSHTMTGRGMAAAGELFERTTRRYARPSFNIIETEIDGRAVAVSEHRIWQAPFCELIHFARDLPRRRNARDSKVLVVAPLSGHHPTLLRGTVEALLQHHDVYLTDWQDARMVPLSNGRFDLDDYIDYLIRMIRLFKGDVNVLGVCQPAVPVLAAISLMEARGEPHLPKSMVLMAGPIDTRVNPTKVNALAERKGIDWFERTVINTVPWPHTGFMRPVYPGFLQLNGFMQMNLDRHVRAHKELFQNLIKGDGDSVEKHREFYDEYLAVMDLTAEFFLQTIKTVFIDHALPKCTMKHRREIVSPAAIKHTALMTIEGELDDITGLGQTESAHNLCKNLSPNKKEHYVQPGVGHYGTFNGSRFRNEIRPKISTFIESQGGGSGILRTVRALMG